MQHQGQPPGITVDGRAHAIGVKALLMIVLVVVVVGAGMKMAGMDLPFIDYAIGPVGADRGPIGPRIEIEPPGFGEFEAP